MLFESKHTALVCKQVGNHPRFVWLKARRVAKIWFPELRTPDFNEGAGFPSLHGLPDWSAVYLQGHRTVGL